MQEIGVEAVVANLSGFLSDMNRVDGALKGLAPSGNLITRTFEGVTSALGSFGREVLNVAEFALGQLLANAIEFVVSKLGELISATIQAGSEFQTMSLRLTRLNFNAIIESGADYVDTMEAAKQATQEQLQWIQKLAVTTPYDAQDIANVFTLARSYGFAADAAKGLTQDISNFAAGMGLGDTEIRRIIINFGQMVQQGKVTQRELNDLARGAFVPVNDVLERMQKNVNMTDEEFSKFQKTGEGVQAFFEAFSQIVEERFNGAAEDMARTWQGATANAQDFIKSLLGLGVVKPVLDAVGGKIADLVSSLTSPEKWDALIEAANNLGDALVGVVNEVMGLLPTTENLADGIVKGIQGLADWINAHKNDIVDFFKGIGTTIQTKVVPFISRIIDAFNTIKTWVTNNKELIGRFFSALGNIISTVFSNLTGGNIQIGGGLQGFLDAIKSFMQWVIENQDAIIPWVEGFIKLFAIVQVVGLVFGVLIGIVGALLAPLFTLGGIIFSVVGIFSILGPIILAVGGFIVSVLIPGLLIGIGVFLAVVAAIAVVVGAFVGLQVIIGLVQGVLQMFVAVASEKFSELRDAGTQRFTELRDVAISKAQELMTGAVNTFFRLLDETKKVVDKMVNAFFVPHWGTIGRSILEEIAKGVINAVDALVNAVIQAVETAFDAAQDAIGGGIGGNNPRSPMFQAGQSAMQQLAAGITSMTGAVAQSVQAAVTGAALSTVAVGASSSAGFGSSHSVSNTNNYNYNLTVNSSAPSEPIIQDYNTLRSLAGA